MEVSTAATLDTALNATAITVWQLLAKDARELPGVVALSYPFEII
jgi:hypothetical protein